MLIYHGIGFDIFGTAASLPLMQLVWAVLVTAASTTTINSKCVILLYFALYCCRQVLYSFVLFGTTIVDTSPQRQNVYRVLSESNPRTKHTRVVRPDCLRHPSYCPNTNLKRNIVFTIYQGFSRVRSNLAGRVGSGRVGSADPTRPSKILRHVDLTRPDPRYFEGLLTPNRPYPRD